MADDNLPVPVDIETGRVISLDDDHWIEASEGDWTGADGTQYRTFRRALAQDGESQRNG